MTERGGLLVFLAVAAGAAAVYWFTSASPQAKYYRAENARRDSVEWLSNVYLSISAESARMDVASAASRYRGLHRRYPRNSNEWIAAGLDPRRLHEYPPNGWIYYTAHRAPPFRGEPMDSFHVSMPPAYTEEYDLTAVIFFGGVVFCKAACTLQR